MNNEFKKIKSNEETRYVLETMTAGATGSGAIATSVGGAGKVQKRNPDNILAQEANKTEVPANKPRNFVAKNAKMGGAGSHRDKKKEQKQGKEKHRKPYMEDHEIQMASNELKSITGDAMKLLMLIKRYSEMEGLEAWQQSKITKAADYLNSVLQSVGGEQDVAEVAPPGWEKTVKAMKKHDEIDNPFALAWSMKNKGYKSHKKESAVGEATPSGNEVDVRRKLIKYIAREKGWGISDLELASTEELIDMYKQCQKDRKAWRDRRSDWMSNADDQARKTGGDKWEIMRKTSKDYDLDGPEQGELNFKEDAYTSSLFSQLEERTKK